MCESMVEMQYAARSD